MCPKFILMVKRSLLLIQTISTWETSYQQILQTETLQKTFVIYINEAIGLLYSDFRVCDSSTLDSLHRTYCMHMYGCELWDINYKYEFKVAWRKIKRRIWGLPYKAHNAIIHNLSYNIDLQLDTRVLKF